MDGGGVWLAAIGKHERIAFLGCYKNKAHLFSEMIHLAVIEEC
jgi:hypothetical protein